MLVYLTGAALPDSLIVRKLRYQVGRPGFRTRKVTLATTLLDADLYPLETLAEIYGVRWRVEQDLRHLKQTVSINVLIRMIVECMLKELTI